VQSLRVEQPRWNHPVNLAVTLVPGRRLKVDHAGSIEQRRHVVPARRLHAWVEAIADPSELSGYAERLAHVAAALVDGADALTASRTIAPLNDAVTVRLLTLAERRLGPAPGPYAWLALGSAGRREQALFSDQDNAIVYSDGGAHAEGYFADLAEAVVAGLLNAGFPACPGGYMATRWHHPLAEWEGVFLRWIHTPEPRAVVEAEVFLDFRTVHGTLVVDPLDAILRQGADHSRFLVHMARAAIAFRPPLTLFGRIRGHGEVDLKRGGLAAIVLLARLYALAGGSVVRPTPDRLSAAARAGTLSREGARCLAAAYRLLADIRLRAQLRAVAEGRAPGNSVPLRELDADTQRALREAFHAVRELQQATALRFHTDAIT